MLNVYQVFGISRYAHHNGTSARLFTVREFTGRTQGEDSW